MIVIIDYGIGNLGSILNMLKRIGADAIVSSDKSDIESADKLILPGVGAFDSGMINMQKYDFVSLLNQKVIEQKTPILGICLGMQLFANKSEEGTLPGLGWFDAEIVKFKLDDSKLKIPAMGWNELNICKPSKLFKDIGDNPRFYFVHSFHLKCNDSLDILAETEYGYQYVSAIEKDNIVGVQFHPEKSHKYGLKLFENFINLY